MHPFHEEMLNNIRMKCLNYPLDHPVKRSGNVAFRDLFDPYCAEYSGIDDDTRLAILREMMQKGIISSILPFYKAFMDMFAEKRPDIANAAPDSLAVLLDHAVSKVMDFVPLGATCQCCHGATCELHDGKA